MASLKCQTQRTTCADAASLCVRAHRQTLRRRYDAGRLLSEQACGGSGPRRTQVQRRGRPRVHVRRPHELVPSIHELGHGRYHVCGAARGFGGRGIPKGCNSNVTLLVLPLEPQQRAESSSQTASCSSEQQRKGPHLNSDVVSTPGLIGQRPRNPGTQERAGAPRCRLWPAGHVVAGANDHRRCPLGAR